jgi:3-methyladenine DNA glycosylase AlkD
MSSELSGHLRAMCSALCAPLPRGDQDRDRDKKEPTTCRFGPSLNFLRKVSQRGEAGPVDSVSLRAMTDLVHDVRQRLKAAADLGRAPAMQAYMKSAMPYLGVTTEPLRRITREVYDAHPLRDREACWESAVRALWDDATFREERYAAMALTSHRLYVEHQDPDALALYRHMIVTGAWWDYVDSLASHNVGAILASYRDEVTPVIGTWAVDEDLWLRRTAIICQLGGKDDTDVALLAASIEENLEGTRFGKEFFIRKAIGWALRQHARVDPEWVRDFVAAHDDRFSGLSRREALKHLK